MHTYQDMSIYANTVLQKVKKLKSRGFTSSDTLYRAKKVLLAAGFIFETVKGHRPNKASWYAVTWRMLDKIDGYDFGSAKNFERSAYNNPNIKSDSLSPLNGLKHQPIAPSDGLKTPFSTPLKGAVIRLNAASLSPPNGNHIYIPSTS